MKAPHNWHFVVGIYRWRVDSPHKGPVIRKHFHVMASSCNSKYSWWITHRPITNGVSHLLNLYFDCSVLSTQITIRFVSVFWLQGCHEPHMKGDAVVWVGTQYPMLLTWNLGSVVPLARKPFQQNSYNFTIPIKRCNRSWSQSESCGNRRLNIQTILKMIRQLHEF